MKSITSQLNSILSNTVFLCRGLWRVLMSIMLRYIYMCAERGREKCQGLTLTKSTLVQSTNSVALPVFFCIVFFFGVSFHADAAFSISGTVYRNNGTTTIGAGTQVQIKVGNTATTSMPSTCNSLAGMCPSF